MKTKPYRCPCRLCKWSRELRTIGKKLNEHDRNKMFQVFSALHDDHEWMGMQLGQQRNQKQND